MRRLRDDEWMLHTATEEWRDALVLSREFETPSARMGLFTRVRRGELIALYRGVYVVAAEWEAMDRHGQYRARVKAAAALAATDPIFSHHSAAVLWRLPLVGEWPRQAHIVVDAADGGRSNTMLARHTVGVPQEFERIDGLAATSLARTVVDLTRVLPFGPAVAVADAALRRTLKPVAGLPLTSVTREDFLGELTSVPLRRGSAKARAVIGFADGAADRPGESMSRVNMHLARLTMPELQVEVAGASGKVYIVDFWWREFNSIGEFDGKWKYTDPEFLRGRTPEQVLYDEKLREDDLRDAGFGFSRWPWQVAISVPRLRAHLVRAGIR